VVNNKHGIFYVWDMNFFKKGLWQETMVSFKHSLHKGILAANTGINVPDMIAM
jgi:hypothetical protein